MAETKFSKQFTARLSPEAEARINDFHAKFQASGADVSSGPLMLAKLMDLAEKGLNTNENPLPSAVLEGEIVVSEAEYNEKTEFFNKFSEIDIPALMDDIERLRGENQTANDKLQEAITEAGKLQNGEFFAFDDPSLELAWAILQKRKEAGKNDGSLKNLVNSVFKFLMIPTFNKMIDAKEKFSYREYLLNIPEDFKKQHNLK